jgi:hypothetical protein
VILERRLLSCLLAIAGVAAAARAELIVFADGRVVKASSFRVSGDQVDIELPGGGGFVVDLDRVERILDDEIVPNVAGVEPLEVSNAVYDLSFRADRKPLFHTPFDSLIESEAKRQNIDASLISALIRAESNYEPRAISRKGARGLMQLMPATARRLSVSYPLDPRSNVRGGVAYLRQLADRFNQKPELILAAYNAGENAVESYGGVPPYRETVEYVKRILSWWTPATVAESADAASARPGSVSTRR